MPGSLRADKKEAAELVRGGLFNCFHRSVLSRQILQA